MILDSIVLENFGAYRGKQEAILTPEDGKPIILFGGMNGGGKTTLLDAIQLAFYGPKATISNRGRLAYKDYLRDSIHRSADAKHGAGITLRFRRIVDGQSHRFELQRRWQFAEKGIEESLQVFCDGVADDVQTQHWDDTVESYLPSSIAHLFFFDGEQIKELADGGNAAGILGGAIHSLLGLDLVDRLETDLKVFERRKKADGLSPEAALELSQARGELEEVDRAQALVAREEGALSNVIGLLSKEARKKQDQFKKDGGDLYLRRSELEESLGALRSEKANIELRLRQLVAGPLPFLLVDKALRDVERRASEEVEIRRAQSLVEALESRDVAMLATLKKAGIAAAQLRNVKKAFDVDRADRSKLAKRQVLLDADESLVANVLHLRRQVAPQAETEMRDLLKWVASLDEKIIRLEGEIARVPTEDRIAGVQRELEEAQKALTTKSVELEAIQVRKQILQRQRQAAEARFDRLGLGQMDARLANDDRQRMLKHSQRVRATLEQFRLKVVRRHAENIEALMLESFRKLLRKKDLVGGLSIDPETFEARLQDRNGRTLPFDRLSAGERQLLATALLWGLARASGRPVPTVIDTPLSRLDSSHRRHLVERYFPFASHQVLLLSTDEEIVGPYHQALKPFISRSYRINHDATAGESSLAEGYF